MVTSRLKVGKVSVRTTGYPSEPGFVRQVNQGMKAIQKDLDYIFAQFEGVTPEILMEALQPTFLKTQERVPQQTGKLKRSGYLEIVTRSSGKVEVELGYAKGGNPDYAVYVHEMQGIPHAPPTSAKFVEQPINEDLGDIIDRIDRGYRQFMGA